MRWPWQRQTSGDLLVCSWGAQDLAFVRAKQNAGVWNITSMGVEQQGLDTQAAFVQRLKDLGLKGAQAVVMLRADQYQFLQIDTPKVPPEELRSAARYQVREMLQAHVDDVTIDLVDVGDGKHQQGGNHSFVVAALNSMVREATDLAQAMDWQMSVIDVQEMAQRNLQSALARSLGLTDRSNAALVLVPGQQALLTICANDELFYTRRFDVPEGFMTGSWGQTVTRSAPVDGFTPVEEYVPSYGSGDLSLGDDFAIAAVSASVKVDAFHADDDQSQRLLVEVQRSLDVWDRSWSSLPLNGLRVFAGERSAELAQWLTQQLGQIVLPMEVGALFAGFSDAPADQQAACLPLLGVFLRTEGGTS
jgi:MSHA biogenesis protein MshI